MSNQDGPEIKLQPRTPSSNGLSTKKSYADQISENSQKDLQQEKITQTKGEQTLIQTNHQGIPRQDPNFQDRKRIIIFGITGSGKTHIIGNIMNAMNEYGGFTLEEDYMSNLDILRYRKISNDFQFLAGGYLQEEILGPTPRANSQNDISQYYLKFNDSRILLIDLPGENCQEVAGNDRNPRFALNDHIKNLITNVPNKGEGCVVLVYDSNTQDQEKERLQRTVLEIFCDHLPQIDKKGYFKKILLINKWDTVQADDYENNPATYLEKNAPGLFEKTKNQEIVVQIFQAGSFTQIDGRPRFSGVAGDGKYGKALLKWMFYKKNIFEKIQEWFLNSWIYRFFSRLSKFK